MSFHFGTLFLGFCGALAMILLQVPIVSAYTLSDHPRMFVNKVGLAGLAERAQGPLSREYVRIKTQADKALVEGAQTPRTRYHMPEDLVCLGIVYLVEREQGNNAQPYAQAVIDFWGDGQILGLDGSGHFGYYALVYDWIYDALTPKQRTLFGNAMGPWLRWYTDTPEITLKNGHWLYNQTWAPAHLNTPNTRDGIAPKLFLSLAIAGAGTDYEDDAQRFLNSWAKRVPAECIPAFDEMGGVWSESMGHGNYGPVAVIPWAFEAWRTATGDDLFQQCAPHSFLPDMTSWAVNLTVPFSDETAWIDDNNAQNLRGFARVAPILGARYKDLVANAISDESSQKEWQRVPWNRLLSYDPTVKPSTPKDAGYELSTLFKGAGHVYLRSAWADPNATWAFFGVGPRLGAHARDDEGHFMIAKKGYLVLRASGHGHNDRDYYTGGSLAFNLVTIYDPQEEFRRTDPGPRQMEEGGTKNENDGGLIRLIYGGHGRAERGHVTAYQHNDQLTYTAADITEGYNANKVREVSRQFLYLRGKREFFVIFDRIEATNAQFPKTWFLHIPTEPDVTGKATVQVPDHVVSYAGDTATWVSDPAGTKEVFSTGKSRAFLKTVWPEKAVVTKRGGDGYELWGNPHEPTAQYNHAGRNSLDEPIVPWRLEVENSVSSERDYFLHVLEIGEESDTQMSRVARLKKGNRVGIRIHTSDQPIEVWFDTQGALSASVKFGKQGEEKLATDLPK